MAHPQQRNPKQHQADGSVDRKSVLAALALVKPALAAQAFIPALTHFMVDGDSIVAYNDVTAIAVDFEMGFEGCVPGELLIKVLSSMSPDEVVMTRSDGHLLVAAGRSKVKLPVLEVSDFPDLFNKNSAKLAGFSAPPEMLSGIELCLLCVGTDQNKPATMGVTLDPAYGRNGAALYSTDNVTMSRFAFDADIKLPGGMQIIMPTAFCVQLVALSKAFPGSDIDVDVYPGHLLATIGGNAVLFSRMIEDLEPMNFDGVMARYVGASEVKAAPVPDGFDAAIDRQLLVLSAAAHKMSRMRKVGANLFMTSTSPLGETMDELHFSSGTDVDFYVDPSLIKRVVGVCSTMSLRPNVMVLQDKSGKFIHMVAHCAPPSLPN